MATILVTGHRDPDLDSIGSAELRGRLDGDDDYVAARLGDRVGARAVLDEAGAPAGVRSVSALARRYIRRGALRWSGTARRPGVRRSSSAST